MPEDLQIGEIYDIVVEHRGSDVRFPMRAVTYRGAMAWWWAEDPDDPEAIVHGFGIRDDPVPRLVSHNRLIEWRKRT